MADYLDILKYQQSWLKIKFTNNQQSFYIILLLFLFRFTNMTQYEKIRKTTDNGRDSRLKNRVTTLIKAPLNRTVKFYQYSCETVTDITRGHIATYLHVIKFILA